MAKVKCADLIGTKWVLGESDCLNACYELLLRASMLEAAEALIGCRATGMASGEWLDVKGENPMLGDLYMSRAPDGELHVSAVCDTVLQRVISASEAHGYYTKDISKLSFVEEVYRYAG